MTEEQEFTYDLSEAFWKLQEKGKCGEMQNNGRRCSNSVTEWFDLNPDRPYPRGNRVGACGVHVEQVVNRIRSGIQRGSLDARKSWEHEEVSRICRALRAAGFRFERGYNERITLNNPYEFLVTLITLGVYDRLEIDIDQPQCSAKTKPRAWSSYEIQCEKYAGHEDEHDDFSGTKWPNVPEPEPEPVSESAQTTPNAPESEEDHTNTLAGAKNASGMQNVMQNQGASFT